MLCSEQGCSDAAGCSTRKHFVKCLSFSACLILIALLVLVYSEAFNCCQIILSPLSHNSLYIAVVKTLWPKAFEGERVSLYLYIYYISSFHWGKLRQELKPWRSIAYWHGLPGLPGLLSYTSRTTHPGVVPPQWAGHFPSITHQKSAPWARWHINGDCSFVPHYPDPNNRLY